MIARTCQPARLQNHNNKTKGTWDWWLFLINPSSAMYKQTFILPLLPLLLLLLLLLGRGDQSGGACGAAVAAAEPAAGPSPADRAEVCRVAHVATGACARGARAPASLASPESPATPACLACPACPACPARPARLRTAVHDDVSGPSAANCSAAPSFVGVWVGGCVCVCVITSGLQDSKYRLGGADVGLYYNNVTKNR